MILFKIPKKQKKNIGKTAGKRETEFNVLFSIHADNIHATLTRKRKKMSDSFSVSI